MPEITDRPVLAGVDGSPESLAALDMAATDASLRRARLVVVYAWAGPHWRPVRTGAQTVSRCDAERLLAVATVRLREDHPDVQVTGRLVLGEPVKVLAAGSVTAELVVVGDRGTGLAACGWGSVAVQLSRRTRAPLVVRTFRAPRAGRAPRGPVVVAVSTAPSDRTLRFAFDEAARLGVPVAPCYVSSPPTDLSPNLGPDLGPDLGPEGEPVRARHRLEEALAGWSARYPQVEVRPEVHHGRGVAQTLAAAARDARLLVVGAGPDNTLTELLSGSVSRGLLRTAGCPVAVVPEPAARAAPPAERVVIDGARYRAPVESGDPVRRGQAAATRRSASLASITPTSSGGSGLAK
jgi:nucleotide-binding universal stress UspA family protein